MRRNIAPTALSVLNTVFGLPAFRGAQEEIVTHVVGGGDCLVLMPTGGGKSLCYQVPALLRDGCGVVVSPLIALMRDQVAGLFGGQRQPKSESCRAQANDAWPPAR